MDTLTLKSLVELPGKLPEVKRITVPESMVAVIPSADPSVIVKFDEGAVNFSQTIALESLLFKVNVRLGEAFINTVVGSTSPSQDEIAAFDTLEAKLQITNARASNKHANNLNLGIKIIIHRYLPLMLGRSYTKTTSK